MPKEISSIKVPGGSGNRSNHSYLLDMRRKYILPFLIAIILLILSEYFFLQEIYGRSNVAILFLTGTGVVLGIAYIISLIKKFN